MQSATLNQVLSWQPCYPESRVEELFAGRKAITALDVLNMEDISISDRFWAVFRPEMISECTQRLFAVWCARWALTLVDNPDPRFTFACDVAERYANGVAIGDELATARATWAAAWSATKIENEAVWVSVRAAVWATTKIETGGAARAAAGDMAGAAAWAAVGDATKNIFEVVAWNAAWNTFWDTAWNAARAAQVECLRAMLIAEDLASEASAT